MSAVTPAVRLCYHFFVLFSCVCVCVWSEDALLLLLLLSLLYS